MAEAELFFNPEQIDAEAFLETTNNPADGINEKVIDDVLNEIQPDFEEDGVSEEVLILLKKLWLVKLHEKHNESPPIVPSASSVSSTSNDPKMENLGARPKSTKLKCSIVPKTASKKKIPQLDGPNDSSDDDDERDDVEDDDDDDDIDEVTVLIFSFL